MECVRERKEKKERERAREFHAMLLLLWADKETTTKQSTEIFIVFPDIGNKCVFVWSEDC